MMTIASPMIRRRNTTNVRPPSRPIALTSLAEATPSDDAAETTNGITVMRMAFTHNAPDRARSNRRRGQRVVPDDTNQHTADDCRPQGDQNPRAFFHERGMRRLHHQVAAGDVQRRTGHVTSLLRRRKAHQVGHFDRGSETRNGIARREALEQLRRRVFVGELRIDHPRTDGVHRDAELAELLRGGPASAPACPPSTPCNARRRAC